MEFIKEPGGEVWVAEAPNWAADSAGPLKIAITLDGIRLRAQRGFRHMVGQLYGVLGPGLILAQHVFQGLKREAYVRDDSRAAEKKLAITWAHPETPILRVIRSRGGWNTDRPRKTGCLRYTSPPTKC